MDPVTILMITLFVLATGGAGGVAVRRKRDRRNRLLMRDAIRSRQAIDGQVEVSIFDVFWDLGSSDFALEVMGSQGILMDDVQELPVALDALSDRIREHGSYAAFVRENLEAIQEFFREHRRAGNRRALPALTSKPRKTLPLPAITADSPKVNNTQNNLPVPYTGRFAPVQRFDDPELARISSMNSNALVLHTPESVGFEVDLDAVTRIDAFAMLKGIFSGRSGELERWWELRTLRGLREELDADLGKLYEYYAAEARSDGSFFRHLYDTSARWDVEARRIDDLLESRPFAAKSWRICAEALLVEARAVARQLSYRSRANVEQTIELIHSHARRGDVAMAGYLVFLNHHAFFAGRGEHYGRFVQRIENQTYRIQQELRDLDQRRVI